MARGLSLLLFPQRAALLGLGLTLLAIVVPVQGQAEDARGEALRLAFGPPCARRNGDQGAPGTARAAAGEEAARVPLTPSLEEWRQRFLAGRCQAAEGRFAEAEATFREGLGESEAFPLLWRWSLAETLVAAGRHEEAAGELGALLEANPGAILTDRVRALLLRLTVAPGEVSPASQAVYLDTYRERMPPTVDDYDLLLRRWELYPADGAAEGRAALALQLWRNPKDERSAERWSELPGKAGVAGNVAFTAEHRLARTSQLFSLRLFELAAREVEEAQPAGDEDWIAKALGRLYFRSLIRGRQLQRAAVQINTPSVIRRFAFDRRQQLIWAIRIQLRRRRIGDVLKYLEELETLAPRDGELPAIFLELLKYNLGRRDEVTSRHWLERIAAEYGATPEASEAYWSVTWEAIKAKDYGKGAELLDMAIRNSEPFHPVDQARLVYWKGRLQIAQGRGTEGRTTWEALGARWPYGYYTALAEWDLNGSPLSLSHARNGSEPKPLPAPAIEKLWALPPFPQALFLFSVGERDLAAEVLRDAVTRQMTPEVLEEASALFHHLEGHYLQLRLMANHLLDTLRTSEVSASPLWWRAYPRPHWEVVRQQADEAGIDPYFVLAIMREESRFFTFADSTAGAKGLMQLMPSTARMVAERDGLPYEENALHLPEMNIPLGTRYLNRVFRRFQGNPIYAAAAYNAGPTIVSRWVRQYGHLPLDEFVERIPFGETQRYVKRVFLSYVVYTKLYR
jgi:soluble lytic murein transglycosylase